MDDDVELLLSGPRGRRLCLRLAGSDPDVASTLFSLAQEMDPSRGSSRRYVAFVSSGPASPPEPPPTLAVLVEQIRSLHRPTITRATLKEALEEAVWSAMYWQPPYGEDVVAEQPEVRDALRPIARAVMSSREVQWWRHPVQSEQWVIDWSSPEFPWSLPQDAAQELARWGEAVRAEEARIAVEDPHARVSGAWWSTTTVTPTTVGWIPDALDLVEDALNWEQARVIPVRAEGRVLEVDADTATIIAGWSPDTTIWLRDVAYDLDDAEEWMLEPQPRVWSRRT
ncbi:hypothetical protein OH146_10360 [Salinibacterium sp. SYSU T00001]|uniref:hypothetical protein n=1 Tax=Homoserinimonas sedimenticola TaxID=2986805 RepID=UPI0022365A40|nr:hypothetical protein [Salinibacterium sedimenticola]MCW4386174.1 hypothetical protein [Salinibacterium sedimenticola]